MKRLLMISAVCSLAFGGLVAVTPDAVAQPQDCSTVICLVCPEGYVASPVPGNCCRCVKAN